MKIAKAAPLTPHVHDSTTTDADVTTRVTSPTWNRMRGCFVVFSVRIAPSPKA